MKRLHVTTQLLIWALLLTPVFSTPLLAEYYEEKPHFIPYPGETPKPWTIRELGPTGIGLVLTEPAFTMKVTGVSKGSPADTSGKIKKGQIIDSINGIKLEKRDPRVILGDIITEAEATDGKLRLQIRDEGEVTIEIPVLGRYSPTWPLNCPKSDKIVDNLAELIARQEKPNWGSFLFLLSTGEDKYLPVMKQWIQGSDPLANSPWGYIPWGIGMCGMGVCEYYLRTGDEAALPIIQRGANKLKELMYAGGWSQRGYAKFTYSTGSGHVNAAAVPCATFLILAKLCGVEVDDYTLQESLKNFYRYAGHDNVGYGNGWPEGGFRDNGKTSALAFTMQAAARLDPADEQSVYARARDISAMKAFYANPWFNRGHTGGGIGEMWHAMAIGFMADKKPEQYRDYMDARRWHFEISRNYGGAMGIDDGGRYDASVNRGGLSWGSLYALAYTMPRKQLILFGAPLTKWCKPFDLPERPWGTAADDEFFSLKPARQPDGKVMDLSQERLRTHCSIGYFAKMGAEDVTPETLLELAHHIDHGIRTATARTLVRKGHKELILPLLKSEDPRVRHTGLLTITGMFKGSAFGMDAVPPEAIGLIEQMLENPQESLWVRLHAAQAMARCGKDVIGKHKATLLNMLEHDDWWVQESAGKALSVIVAEPEHYQEVIPAMAEFCAGIENAGMIWSFPYAKSGLMQRLAAAPEPIRELAARHFVQGHAEKPVIMRAKGGHVVTMGGTYMNEWLGKAALHLLGDKPLPKTMALSTSHYRKSLNEADLLNYDGRFSPDPDVLATWEFAMIIADPASLPDILDGKAKALESPRHKPKPMQFNDGGTIAGDPGAVWTRGLFVDLLRREARKMVKQTHNGQEYLLIESGLFDNINTKMPADWKPAYTVFKKKG